MKMLGIDWGKAGDDCKGYKKYRTVHLCKMKWINVKFYNNSGKG